MNLEAPRSGTTAYYVNHHRVHRLRGRASDHQCATCCEPAKHWATVHGEDGSDPYRHYMPMCIPCHHAYDAPVCRPKMSAAAKRRGISDTTRAKITASLKGKRQSEDERRKKSEALKRYWAEKRRSEGKTA